MNSIQKALISNAFFSLLTGFLLIFLDENIARLFDIENTSFFIYLGTALLFFSSTVFYEVKRQRKKMIHLIILQDILWVVASLIICLFSIFSLSTIGYCIILGVALIVGVFALLQYKWSRSLQ